MKSSKKHLDFEINLIPCIDLLSVCICFLLLTAVWLNVGSLNVKQAVGGQTQEDTPKNPVMWVRMSPQGELELDVQQSQLIPANLRKVHLAKVNSLPDWSGFERNIVAFRQLDPGLKTGLIQPAAVTAYEDIIDLMDKLKANGLTDLGVSPL